MTFKRNCSPIAVGKTLCYVGSSSPEWRGMTGKIVESYSFDGSLWCYRVELPHGLETWMDNEAEEFNLDAPSLAPMVGIEPEDN